MCYQDGSSRAGWQNEVAESKRGWQTSLEICDKQGALRESGMGKHLLSEVGRHLGPLLEDEYIVMDLFLPLLRSALDDAVTGPDASLVETIAILNSCITSSQVGARPCSLDTPVKAFAVTCI